MQLVLSGGILNVAILMRMIKITRHIIKKLFINIKMMKFLLKCLLEDYIFDVVITSHGIYSIWGTAYNYFKSKGIKVYVHGPHAYRNCHTHFTDTLAQTLSKDSSCIEYMKSGTLDDNIKKVVDDYFLARRNHTTKTHPFIIHGWISKRNLYREKR